MTGAGPAIEASGDQALMVRFGTRIDPESSARAQALAARVRAAEPPWLVDCVPSYAAVLIVFDPLAIDATEVQDFIRLQTRAAASATAASGERASGRPVEIPVCYAPELAPDLLAVARERGLSVDDVVRRHAGLVYRVYALGFRPGFAFMGTIDDAIAVPRLATPRARVPAGAVGIAGRQTGIYPGAGPGGWRLVGRTPWRLFDPAAPAPFRLAAGDRVRFVPIGVGEFHRLRETPDDD